MPILAVDVVYSYNHTCDAAGLFMKLALLFKVITKQKIDENVIGNVIFVKSSPRVYCLHQQIINPLLKIIYLK